MKEPDVEGVATRNNPESCVGGREADGEALTGARAGWVLSHEISEAPGADAVFWAAGDALATDSAGRDVPAWSETPCKRGTFLRENREICRPPTLVRGVGRIGKAMAASR